MDGNKDEALKCLKIGKDALEAGDRARALKFVTKARRLDPNLPRLRLHHRWQEAFKAVSKAFQCLSNEESRKKYDLVGSDEPVYERHPATRRANGFNGFYDGDVDAEEIFRNFFFGGMPQATTQFRGFAFGPGMGTRTEPMYAFARSYPYEYRFVTQKGVNYYVKSTKFEQDYPSNSHERVAFEARVEREYFALLSQNCRHELQRLQWGFIRETPHCDMLKQFEAVA
ncbi:unnamed protein product, partial [Vitis vinifera]